MKITFLNIISKELEQYHDVHDLDWKIFLLPFYNAFFDYCKIDENSNNINENKLTFKVPYGNNDFITSLEKETEYYQLLSQNNFKSYINNHIAPPIDQYIKNYVFGYSEKRKIAYLDFFNGVFDKYILYLYSLFDIKKCQLNYFQEKDLPIDIEYRNKLIRILIAKLGKNYTKLITVFVYSIPSIYIENFKFYYQKALIEERKLLKVEVVFFLRHVFFNPTFLILLSLKQIRTKKLVTYQHGGVYGQTKANWSERTEKVIATHFLTWGYKNDKIDIPFISLRFKKSISIPNFFVAKKGIIIILPLLFREEQVKSIENSCQIINELIDNKIVDVRFDPREKNQEKIIDIFQRNKISIQINESKEKLPQAVKKYRSIIFITPNATGYLELINLGHYPLMIFCKSDWNICDKSLSIYKIMKNNGVWIDFDNVHSGKLNEFSMQQKKAIDLFRNNFINTSFFPRIKLVILLHKMIQRSKI